MTTEITGLISAQQFAAGMAAAHAGAIAPTDTFRASVTAAGVTGDAVAAADRAAAAQSDAAAAWQRVHTALLEQDRVAEAYATASGAGSKEFLTDTGAVPTSPLPAQEAAVPDPTTPDPTTPDPTRSGPATNAAADDATDGGEWNYDDGLVTFGPDDAAYIDWLTAHPDGGRTLEFSDGQNAIHLRVHPDELQTLHDRIAGTLDGTTAPGEQDLEPRDPANDPAPYIDWSARNTDGTRQFEVGADDYAVTVDLTDGQLRGLRDRLAAELADPPAPRQAKPTWTVTDGALRLGAPGEHDVPYVDWSVQQPGGGRTLQLSDEQGDIAIDLDADQLHDLGVALEHTLNGSAGSDDSDDSDDSGLYTDNENGDYVDWSSRTPSGGYWLEVGDNTDAVNLQLTAEQLRAFFEQLTAPVTPLPYRRPQR